MVTKVFLRLLSKVVTKVFERLLSKVLEIIPFLFFPIKINTCCVNRYQRQHMLEGGKSSYSREVGSVCLLLIGSGSQTHLLLVVTFSKSDGDPVCLVIEMQRERD